MNYNFVSFDKYPPISPASPPQVTTYLLYAFMYPFFLDST